MKVKRIGLWGGSFNPPTLAHKALAHFAFDALGLDELRWVVCPHNPEKDPATLAPFEHRFAMVSQVLKHDDAMVEDDIEQKQGVSLTLNTVKAVRATHPDDYLFFLMGADNWLGFHQWGPDFAQILDYASLAVMVRPGYPELDQAAASKIFADRIVETPQQLAKHGKICFVKNPRIDMAATQVRKALKDGKNPEQIEAETLAYIKKHNLYGTGL